MDARLRSNMLVCLLVCLSPLQSDHSTKLGRGMGKHQLCLQEVSARGNVALCVVSDQTSENKHAMIRVAKHPRGKEHFMSTVMRLAEYRSENENHAGFVTFWSTSDFCL